MAAGAGWVKDDGFAAGDEIEGVLGVTANCTNITLATRCVAPIVMGLLAWLAPVVCLRQFASQGASANIRSGNVCFRLCWLLIWSVDITNTSFSYYFCDVI